MQNPFERYCLTLTRGRQGEDGKARVFIALLIALRFAFYLGKFNSVEICPLNSRHLPSRHPSTLDHFCTVGTHL